MNQLEREFVRALNRKVSAFLIPDKWNVRAF